MRHTTRRWCPWSADSVAAREAVRNRHPGRRSPARPFARADAAVAAPLPIPHSPEEAEARAASFEPARAAGMEATPLRPAGDSPEPAGAALLGPARKAAGLQPAPPLAPLRLKPQTPPGRSDSELACRRRYPEHSTAAYRMDRLRSSDHLKTQSMKFRVWQKVMAVRSSFNLVPKLRFGNALPETLFRMSFAKRSFEAGVPKQEFGNEGSGH